MHGTCKGVASPSQNSGICPPTISVVIATHNRRHALQRTLAELLRQSQELGLEIIVVDNASEDDTLPALKMSFPDVRFIGLPTNSGIEAYNTGAASARGRYLLILDDDACPQPGTLLETVRYLDRHGRVGAVSLHPRHPSNGVSEWPFLSDGSRVRAWPLLVAGSVVRREAWVQVGGYEGSFFLYVNDTDLALKLLAAGWEVYCDWSWVVWHDTPTAIRRPIRWFELATRNRVWLARRHLRGPMALVGAMAALAEAQLRAGLCSRRHAASLRGAWRGLRTDPPRLPAGVRPAERLFWRLLAVKLGMNRGRVVAGGSDAGG